MKYSVLSLFLLFFTTVAESIEGEGALEVEEHTELKRLKFTGIIDYISASNSNSGESISAMGFGGVFTYGLNKKWAMGASIKQSFSPGGGQGLVTSLDGRLTYAITGSMVLEKSQTKIEGKTVTRLEELGTGGWRVDLMYTQLNFNSSSSSVPFSGLGAAVYYEYQTKRGHFYQAGLRYDQTSNASQTVSVASFFIGIGLWF